VSYEFVNIQLLHEHPYKLVMVTSLSIIVLGAAATARQVNELETNPFFECDCVWVAVHYY